MAADPEYVVGTHPATGARRYLTGAWTGPYRDAAAGGTVHAEDGHATFIAGLIPRHAPAATLRVYPVRGTAPESTILSGTVSVWEDPDGNGPAPARRHDREFQGYARWSGTSFAAAVVSAMIPGGRPPPR